MSKFVNSFSLARTVAAAAMLAAFGATGASAQLLGTPSLAVPTGQALAGVAVGNGVVQGQRVVNVAPAGQPKVGISALSSGPNPGNSTHFGSSASVSVLNNEQLLGVQGPGGRNSKLSVSIANPRGAPVLSKRN